MPLSYLHICIEYVIAHGAACWRAEKGLPEDCGDRFCIKHETWPYIILEAQRTLRFGSPIKGPFPKIPQQTQHCPNVFVSFNAPKARRGNILQTHGTKEQSSVRELHAITKSQCDLARAGDLIGNYFIQTALIDNSSIQTLGLLGWQSLQQILI